jgi:hypothetical protein
MITNEHPVQYQTTKMGLEKIYKYLIQSELLMKFFLNIQLMILKGYLKQHTTILLNNNTINYFNNNNNHTYHPN